MSAAIFCLAVAIIAWGLSFIPPLGSLHSFALDGICLAFLFMAAVAIRKHLNSRPTP